MNLAIFWLKNYSRYRSDACSSFLQQPSIYLMHQLNLPKAIQKNPKKSTPSKDFAYNGRRRSSVWQTVVKPLGQMTKSFTENSIDQLLEKQPDIVKKLTKTISRDQSHTASRDISDTEIESNKFCEFIGNIKHNYYLKSSSF